jgi:hypothetical protein
MKQKRAKLSFKYEALVSQEMAKPSAHVRSSGFSNNNNNNNLIEAQKPTIVEITSFVKFEYLTLKNEPRLLA